MSESAPRQVLPVWITFIGVICGVTAYFWSQGDMVTAGVLMVLAMAGLLGFRMGFARIGGTLAGFTLAFLYAPTVGRFLEPHVSSALELSGMTARVFSIGAAGLAIAMGVAVTTRILSRCLLKDRPLLTSWNEFLGAALAVAQGAALVLLMLGAALAIEPVAKSRLYQPRQPKDALARATSKRIVTLAKQTKSSAIGPWVVNYNPFERVAYLQRLKKSTQFANSGSNWGGNPAAWGSSPEIQQALEALKEQGRAGF